MSNKQLTKFNYFLEDGSSSFDVQMDSRTVWLSQKDMAGLFGKTRVAITQHIGNIYSEGELEKTSTSKNFLLVQKEGVREISREVEHYNLDVIISVGYRVKSKRGTQFRIWATKILREYLLDQRQKMMLEDIDKAFFKIKNQQKRIDTHGEFHIDTYEMIRYLFEKIDPGTELFSKKVS